MTESAVRKTVNGESGMPLWGSAPMRIKKAVESTVEDCASSVRRAVKRGRFAAEDLMNEAAHSVKKRPLKSVALTFGLAFGVGALVGWIATNNHKR
jgi:hypothetical protein